MWPFKSKPRMSLDEWAETKLPAPCGNQHDHYYWTLQGWPCSVCASKQKEKRQHLKDERMAKMIADRLFELGNKNG